MINRAVKFKDLNHDEIIGLVYDKVRVLIVGTNSNFDNYVIMDNNGKIYIVNPINIIKMVPEWELKELYKVK